MRKKTAFSLIELSIVLIIAAALIAAVMNGYSKWDKKAQIQKQVDDLNIVKQALLKYYEINGRLPCPAPMNVTPDNSTFGVAAYCYSMISGCAAGLECNSAQFSAGGDIPAKTLGLPVSIMANSKGFKYRYLVDYRFANYINSATSTAKCTGFGGLRVRDPVGTNLQTQIIFAVVSLGNTGVGARHVNTGAVEIAGGGTFATNYDGDNALVFNFNVEQAASILDIFDDIFVTATNPIVMGCPGGLGGCFTWFDGADECSYAIDSSNRFATGTNKGSTSALPYQVPARPTVETAQASLINGNRFVNFASASNEYASSRNIPIVNSSQSYTVVFRTNSASASAFFTLNNNGGWINSGTPFVGMGLNATGNVISVIDGDTVTSTSAFNDNRIHIATVIWQGSAPNRMQLFVDGIQQAETTAVSPWTTAVASPAFVVGGNTNAPWGMYNGAIFEIVGVDQALNHQQRIKLESELAKKWSIPY